MFITDLTEEPLSGITLLFGTAASGKTTACLEALSGRSIYISTNKNFNVERLRNLRPDADEIIKQLVLFEPKDLTEMEKAVASAAKLSSMAKILVIDSIATFFRTTERKSANLGLHRMLMLLEQVKCPVLMTSEVYDYLRESRHEFVGGDMLRVAARTIIELKDGVAIVKKHPAHTGREWNYHIADAGLEKQ